MTKTIEIQMQPDGGAVVTLPQGDACWKCSGDGFIKLDTPLPARGRFKEITGMKVLTWCHQHSDYECNNCLHD